MDKHMETNRARWEDLAALHVELPSYGLPKLQEGGITLREIELGELGDVAGRSLLHLQCHFGLDTLSWARLGAQVTGLDFSEQAIATARRLSTQLDIPARFVCADVYALDQHLDEQYDIVFTSYGVLCWLDDLRRWAQLIAGRLRPGGRFYIVELHPYAEMLEWDAEAGQVVQAYSYFHPQEPYRCQSEGSYADATAQLDHTVSYQWGHALSEVVGALLEAGLTLEWLHEFPYCMYPHLPVMVQDEAGWWRLPGQGQDVPWLFSLGARKPA